MEILRVASLNICNRTGPWDTRLRLIRRELARVDAHVVGLQEVLRAESAPESSLAHEIAAGLGYEVAFAPACDLGGGLMFGNGVLSRFPIAEVQSWPLPVGRPDDGRGLLLARVDAPCGRVPFFVTHLSYPLHDGAVRVRQVAEIADRVRESAPIAGFPPVLVGDFNAEPDSDEIRFLKGLAVLGGQSVYFADAYAHTGELPGHTWDARNPAAAQYLEPSRRLDYVFVRGPVRDGRGQVLSARLAWDEAEGDVYPSDHFGVVVEIRSAPLRSS